MSKKIFFLFSSSFLLHSFLFAQDSAYNELNEVVVTANKIAQKQNTTGKIITVIGKDIIDKSTGKTLPQLLNEQAGVVVNGALNNQGSVQTVYTRGAASGRTLILLDGIPVNDPSMINNEFDLNLLSLNDVERIEICRGAQSTLYGSDAVAGVINIITTKTNVSKPLNGSAMISAGNYGTVNGGAQLFGKINKWSYTARYTQLYTSGFSSATDTARNPNQKFDNDGYNGEAVNAQVLYQATNALSFKTFALYSRYNAGIDAAAFTDDKDDSIHNKTFMSGAGFVFKKTKFSITGNYQYSEMKRHYLNDSSDKTNIIFEDNHYAGFNQFAELYGSIVLGKNITLIAGGDYRFSSYHQLYVSVSDFGPYNDTVYARSVRQTSAYASLILKSQNQKLNIEAGGRINHHSIYGTNSTFTFNPSYQINNLVRIFGSVSSGYKAPGIFQLFDVYSGNKTLKAEQSINYEAGIALQTKTFTARADAFYRDIKNGIDYNYVSFQYFNYVKQKVMGAEWEATLKPASWLSLNVNYTFLSPRETSQNRVTDKDTITYHYLLRRPNNSLNATLAVQPVKPLYISMSVKYVSQRYDVGGYQAPDVLLKPYCIFNAYAEYNFQQKVKLFLQAQNLFNIRFYDVYGYNSIPFLLNGGVRFSF